MASVWTVVKALSQSTSAMTRWFPASVASTITTFSGLMLRRLTSSAG
ncbi:MAG: hypothetical protein BWY99_02863 [Synergistetes bacterium ADurb.BinA166]|nr:MAG: hypothetical protein BWY99_02863 [Synergistetes bacterium ADurb.BinA166]